MLLLLLSKATQSSEDYPIKAEDVSSTQSRCFTPKEIKSENCTLVYEPR